MKKRGKNKNTFMQLLFVFKRYINHIDDSMLARLLIPSAKFRALNNNNKHNIVINILKYSQKKKTLLKEEKYIFSKTKISLKLRKNNNTKLKMNSFEYGPRLYLSSFKPIKKNNNRAKK